MSCPHILPRILWDDHKSASLKKKFRIIQKVNKPQVDFSLRGGTSLKSRFERRDTNSPHSRRFDDEDVDAVIGINQLLFDWGVVDGGTVMAEMVPIEGEVTVRARVNTDDVSKITVGQDVRISLTAYDVSRYGTLTGEVQKLANNSTQEENLPPYFVTLIKMRKRSPPRPAIRAIWICAGSCPGHDGDRRCPRRQAESDELYPVTDRTGPVDCLQGKVIFLSHCETWPVMLSIGQVFRRY